MSIDIECAHQYRTKLIGYLRLPPGGQIYLEREAGGGTVI